VFDISLEHLICYGSLPIDPDSTICRSPGFLVSFAGS